METKHTPTPWTYFVGNSNGRGLIRIESSIDAPVSGEHIASMPRNKQSEANAELIIKAVNSHPALLAALRGLLKDAPSTETLDAVNAEYTFRKVTLTVTDVDIRAAHSALLSAE